MYSKRFSDPKKLEENIIKFKNSQQSGNFSKMKNSQNDLTETKESINKYKEKEEFKSNEFFKEKFNQPKQKIGKNSELLENKFKKKISHAKFEADRINDQMIKQINFEKEDEEEENNFIELFDTLKNCL